MGDFFELRARKTTVGREVRGAVTTFLTMAYILFANPSILAAAGVPFEAAVAATGAAAAVSCLLMIIALLGVVISFRGCDSCVARFLGKTL